MKKNFSNLEKELLRMIETNKNIEITENSLLCIEQLLSNGVISKNKTKKSGYKINKKIFSKIYHIGDDIIREDKIFRNTVSPFLLEFTPNITGIWEYTFEEMLNNAIEHSKGDTIKIGVIQSDFATTVLIIDNGMGIFSKIKGYFSLESIDDAVLALFKGKQTTDEEHHTGEGIFFSSKMLDTFAIISDSNIFVCGENSNTLYNFKKEVSQNFPSGTTVYMRLENQSNKKSTDIFAKYSDNEFGFSKTYLPLKEMFHSENLCSRSAAKRLLLGLNKFIEIELDFSDIAFVSRSFCHEIFVLFQKENPNIKLVPTNCIDDICFTIKSVINTK